MVISDGSNPCFTVVSFYLNLASDLFQLFVYLCFFAIGLQISPASSNLDPKHYRRVFSCIFFCFFAIFIPKILQIVRLHALHATVVFLPMLLCDGSTMPPDPKALNPKGPES